MSTLGEILIAALVVVLLALVGREVWLQWIKKPHKDDSPAWLRNGEEERGPWGKDE